MVPMPNKKVNIEYYEKHSRDLETRVEKKQQVDYFLKKIKDFYTPRGAKVLDAGCGVGLFGAEFRSRFKASVYGFDISKSAVVLANQNGIKARLADIDSKWPYENSYFDVVLGIQIIEHVFNTDNFFVESNRVLKKGGILIISTPNLAAWYNRIIFLLGYQPFFTEVSTVDKTLGLDFTRKLTSNRETLGHVRVFTSRALEDILTMYEFGVVKKIGGAISYLPLVMKPFDAFFANFPSLASDLILIARKA